MEHNDEIQKNTREEIDILETVLELIEKIKSSPGLNLVDQGGNVVLALKPESIQESKIRNRIDILRNSLV